MASINVGSEATVATTGASISATSPPSEPINSLITKFVEGLIIVLERILTLPPLSAIAFKLDLISASASVQETEEPPVTGPLNLSLL